MPKYIRRAFSPLFLLALWEVAARLNWIDHRFFPAPSLIFRELWSQLITGNLGSDVAVSLLRLACGLLIGGIPAMIIGILMARSRLAHDLFHPLVVAGYPVPKIAILPLIILMFGLGEWSKIVIIAAGTFFLMALSVLEGVSRIEKRYFSIARLLRLSAAEEWRSIIIPAAMPALLHGLKLSVGSGFMLLVASEFFASHSGIGYRIWASWENFNITALYGGLFTIMLLAIGLQAGIETIEKRALPWRISEEE
ncbi:MAG: ABC transporter permease [Candidatus Omnitrophota bacterium]